MLISLSTRNQKLQIFLNIYFTIIFLSNILLYSSIEHVRNITLNVMYINQLKLKYMRTKQILNSTKL